MRLWQDDTDRKVRLNLERCAAAIDWYEPAGGLQDVTVDGQTLEGFHPLGPELTALEPAEVPAAEHYARGGDLVATYPNRPAPQSRCQVYWRAGTHAREGSIAAIELMVSVQTALLDSCPRIALGSRLLATDALRMTDADHGDFVSIVPPSADADPDGIAGAPHCYLFRLPGRQYSYVEMIHPADVQTSNWDGWLHGANYLLQLRHELFADRLEKGVILRARVLGILLDRRDDKNVALHHWRQFLAEKPPLTT